MRRIKVCHIITKMVYGGASLGTLHLVESLDLKRFHSSVICGVQSENEGSLLNNIEEKKFEIIIVPEIVREINPFKDIIAFLKLIHIIKIHKYDIIHTHGSKAGVIGRLAAKFSKVPIILFTVHGWGLKAGSFVVCRIFRLIEKILAVFTTKILFQTRADMNEAFTCKIGKQSQYVLIGNGINLQPFFNYNKKIAEQIRKKLKLKNKRVVGTVGRVSAQKNPVGFINIAQEVLKKRQDTTFVFVGGGEMLEEMRRLVKGVDLEKSIIFTGVRDDIPEVISNFDIFILPSLWEGMPRSLIEAMALSKPVIVHNISGINEVVKDGINGLIVPINQTTKFAEKINILLNKPQLAKKLGNSGKETAKNFDFSKVVKKTETLYIQLFSQTN